MSEPLSDRSVCTCSGDPNYVDPDCPTHGPESGFPAVVVRYREQAVERLAESLYLWAAQNTDAMIGGVWEAESDGFKDGWRDAEHILDVLGASRHPLSAGGES